MGDSSHGTKRKRPAPARSKKRSRKAASSWSGARRSRSNVGLHHFRRYAQSVSGNYTITGNAAFAPYQAAQVYALSHLATVTDFSNLFDQYRINKVVTKFWLRIDPSAQTAAAASYPKLYMAIDNDDTALLSQQEMRERSNTRIKVLYPNRPVTVVFTPAVLSETYRSAVSTTYSPKWKQWIDMSATDCPHYALKFNIDDLTNTNYRVDVETIMYFSCRSVR